MTAEAPFTKMHIPGDYSKRKRHGRKELVPQPGKPASRESFCNHRADDNYTIYWLSALYLHELRPVPHPTTRASGRNKNNMLIIGRLRNTASRDGCKTERFSRNGETGATAKPRRRRSQINNNEWPTTGASHLVGMANDRGRSDRRVGHRQVRSNVKDRSVGKDSPATKTRQQHGLVNGQGW